MRTCWSCRIRTSWARRHDSSVVSAQPLSGLGYQDVPWGGGQRGVVGQGGDELGIALDRLDQCPAGPEQQAQAPGGLGGLPKRGDQKSAMVRVHDKVAKTQEPEVGVGGERQPVEQKRKELGHEAGAACQSAGKLLDGRTRTRGVGEAEGGESLRHGLGRHDGGCGVLPGGV